MSAGGVRFPPGVRLEPSEPCVRCSSDHQDYNEGQSQIGGRLDIIVTPVGWVRSPEKGKREDYWGEVVSEIVLDSGRFSPAALEGLAEFSHIEVLFHLDRVQVSQVETGRRHPRGHVGWPEVGIFAQRAKSRPNRIAASICRVLSVQGLTITVQGLDALDGSPVLDIKPVMAEFLPDRKQIRQPEWACQLMKEYFSSR